MFRMWCRIFQDNHLLKDTVIIKEDDTMTRTQKIFSSVEDACMDFDLPVPLWLDANIREFKRHSKTRFRKDSFIEEIDFDYLEVLIIEE